MYSATDTSRENSLREVTLDGEVYNKETTAWEYTFEDLTAGSYTVVETVNGRPSESDYDKTETGEKTVAVTAGSTVTAAFTNTYAIKTGSLTVHKDVAGTGAPSDAKFGFKVQLGTGDTAYNNVRTYRGPGVYTFSLGDDGDFTITGIPYNTTYEVAEEDYSAHYVTTTSGNTEGAIASGTAAVTVNFTNTYFAGSFSIRKVDDKGTLITDAAAAAVFKLYSDENCTSVVSGYDNIVAANGEATVSGLAAGTYYLKESSAPTDYNKSETTWKVTVAAGGAVTMEKVAGNSASSLRKDGEADLSAYDQNTKILTVYNTRQTGYVTVRKLVHAPADADITGSFAFRIYSDAEGKNPVGEEITLAGGNTSSAIELPTGTYYVQEINAPDQTNYQLTGTSYTVDGTGATANASTSLVAFTVTNEHTTAVVCTNTYAIKTGSLTVAKNVVGTDTSEAFTIVVTLGNGSGEKVTVTEGTAAYTENGVYTFTLSNGGSADITGIPYATSYTVKEQYTEPFGYVVAYNNEKGTIGAGTTTATVTNTYVTSGFVVKKVDKDTKAGLPGAEFTLYTDENCNSQYGSTYTTDENGYISIDGLPAGTYWLKETKTPTDYIAESDPVWKIQVSANNSTTVTEVTVTEETGNPVATFIDSIITFFKGGKDFTVEKQEVKLESEKLTTAVLTVENTAIKYRLPITKTVTGDNVSTDRAFNFNVYASDVNGTKGTQVGTVSVKAGETKYLVSKNATGTGEELATWLKAGYYLVEEDKTAAAVNNYTWLSVDFDPNTTGNRESALVHITDTAKTETITAATVSAQNTYARDMGTLTVTKTFSGPANLPESFQIRISATGETDVVKGLSDASKHDGTYTWTIPVKTNVTYTVTEENTTVINWTLSASDSTVRGEATVTTKGGTGTVGLRNVYTRNQGGLTISKNVDGDLSKETVGKTFTFSVYEGTDTTGTAVKTVTLPKDGQWSATVQVDDNTTYTVVESGTAPAGYSWTVKNGNGDITDTKAIQTTVSANGSASVSFTNHYEKLFHNTHRASFDIYKTDVTSGTGVPMNGVTLGLYADEDCEGTPIATVTTGADGKAAIALDNSDLSGYAEKGTATFYLKEMCPPVMRMTGRSAPLRSPSLPTARRTATAWTWPILPQATPLTVHSPGLSGQMARL